MKVISLAALAIVGEMLSVAGASPSENDTWFSEAETTSGNYAWLNLENENVGPDPIRRLIIDGQKAIPLSKPYVAAVLRLANGGISLCGGVLIAPEVVLTAAHCVAFDAKQDYVYLGAHNLAGGPTLQMLSIGETIVSSLYTSVSEGDDYALILLNQPADMENLALARLNRDPLAVASGDTLQVVGWGQTEATGLRSLSALKEADVIHRSNAECSEMNDRFKQFDHPTTMCASYGTGIPCWGDSGNPLLIPGNSTDYSDDIVVGITSFGLVNDQGNCLPELPTVYSSIHSRFNWISTLVCSYSTSELDDFSCKSLPRITLVVGGTGNIESKLEVVEDDGRFHDALSFRDSITDEVSRTFFLYPSEDGPREYAFHFDFDGDLDMYQLWYGTADDGILIRETLDFANMTEVYPFLVSDGIAGSGSLTPLLPEDIQTMEVEGRSGPGHSLSELILEDSLTSTATTRGVHYLALPLISAFLLLLRVS